MDTRDNQVTNPWNGNQRQTDGALYGAARLVALAETLKSSNFSAHPLLSPSTGDDLQAKLERLRDRRIVPILEKAHDRKKAPQTAKRGEVEPSAGVGRKPEATFFESDESGQQGLGDVSMETFDVTQPESANLSALLGRLPPAGLEEEPSVNGEDTETEDPESDLEASALNPTHSSQSSEPMAASDLFDQPQDVEAVAAGGVEGVMPEEPDLVEEETAPPTHAEAEEPSTSPAPVHGAEENGSSSSPEPEETEEMSEMGDTAAVDASAVDTATVETSTVEASAAETLVVEASTIDTATYEPSPANVEETLPSIEEVAAGFQQTPLVSAGENRGSIPSGRRILFGNRAPGSSGGSSALERLRAYQRLLQARARNRTTQEMGPELGPEQESEAAVASIPETQTHTPLTNAFEADINSPPELEPEPELETEAEEQKPFAESEAVETGAVDREAEVEVEVEYQEEWEAAPALEREEPPVAEEEPAWVSTPVFESSMVTEIEPELATMVEAEPSPVVEDEIEPEPAFELEAEPSMEAVSETESFEAAEDAQVPERVEVLEIPEGMEAEDERDDSRSDTDLPSFLQCRIDDREYDGISENHEMSDGSREIRDEADRGIATPRNEGCGMAGKVKLGRGTTALEKLKSLQRFIQRLKDRSDSSKERESRLGSEAVPAPIIPQDMHHHEPSDAQEEYLRSDAQKEAIVEIDTQREDVVDIDDVSMHEPATEPEHPLESEGGQGRGPEAASPIDDPSEPEAERETEEVMEGENVAVPVGEAETTQEPEHEAAWEVAARSASEVEATAGAGVIADPSAYQPRQPRHQPLRRRRTDFRSAREEAMSRVGFADEMSVHRFAGAGAGGAAGAQWMDLHGFLRCLWRRRLLISAFVGLVTLATFIAVLVVTPQYTATAKVKVADERGSYSIDSPMDPSVLLPDEEAIESEVQVITSPQLAQRVIEKQGLYKDPEFNEEVSGSKVTVELPRDTSSDPTDAAAAGDEEPEEQHSLAVRARVVDGFLKRIGAWRAGRSRVIAVSFDSRSPEKAAKIVNAIVDEYVSERVEARFSAANSATDWVNERLQDLRESVAKSETAVERYRQESGLLEGERTTIISQQLSDLSARMIAVRSHRVSLEAKLERIEAAGKENWLSIPDVLSNALISDLRTEEYGLSRRLAELGADFGPSFSQRRKLEAQIKRIRADIAAEVQRVVVGLRREVEAARVEEQGVASALEALKLQAGDLNVNQGRLRALEREANANQAVLETFLQWLKKTTGVQQYQEADARVISYAEPPLRQSFPRKRLFVGLAFLGSLTAAVALVLTMENLDRRFRSPGQLEQHTGYRALPVIPALDAGWMGKAEPEKHVLSHTLSPYTEAIRSLHASIMTDKVHPRPKSILIASSFPNEGKSTLAISYARVLAKRGYAVTLVDADLRHGMVAEKVGIAGKTGLANVLAGEIDIEDAIEHDPETPLKVVVAGASKRSPQELLHNGYFISCLEHLSAMSDFVIIDSPPVLAVSDVSLIGRSIDSTVYVARWAVTSRSEALAGLRVLREADANIVGVVLNATDMSKYAEFAYGRPSIYKKVLSHYYAT